MIIFVGVQSRGYFLTETAKRKGEKVTYVTGESVNFETEGSDITGKWRIHYF